MAQLNDKQTDIILQRILGGGVTTTGLQNDLLDHYCCYIEAQMDGGADFETAWREAYEAISPNGLQEIEEELHLVLSFKNYTNMKRTILITGAISTAMLATGIIFKYLFMPGASALIVSGITIAALVFIPLVFLLRIREKETVAEKVQWGIGSIFAIVLAFGVLFKVQHWPGANVLGSLAPLILLVFFLPVYFASGYRRSETRVNTVVTSVFIVVGCGLFFTMLMTPRAAHIVDARLTKSYLRSEQILKSEHNAVRHTATDTPANATATLGEGIYKSCEELKSFLIKSETGSEVITDDFEKNNQLISDHSAMDYFYNTPGALAKLNDLCSRAAQYNISLQTGTGKMLPIPVTSNIIDLKENKTQYKVHNALDDLIQIQMILLQNEKGIAAL